MIIFISLAILVLAVRAWSRQRRADRDLARRFVHHAPRITFAPPPDPVVAWSVDFNKPYTPPRKLAAAELLAPYLGQS
jgi:hypothetical protein